VLWFGKFQCDKTNKQPSLMEEILMIVWQIQSYNVFLISLTNNIAIHHMLLTIMHLDSVLLHITNNDEITKKQKRVYI